MLHKYSDFLSFEPCHAERALSVAVTYLINDVIFSRYKKMTRVCLKMFSALQSYLRHALTSEPRKISELPPYSHCSIKMMLSYKIMEVKLCMLLPEHHDVTFAENDAVAYTPCLGPHRKLILLAILVKVS